MHFVKNNMRPICFTSFLGDLFSVYLSYFHEDQLTKHWKHISCSGGIGIASKIRKIQSSLELKMYTLHLQLQ